ncbi:unnamed protein product [marine sediment metagenome]|uniref:Uncharacterized protein n=1 Tax=marine sediment metagenome TaxID=412755 RepID=X1TN24_9ZZZZ
MYCEICKSPLEQIDGNWYICWDCQMIFELKPCDLPKPEDMTTIKNEMPYLMEFEKGGHVIYGEPRSE